MTLHVEQHLIKDQGDATAAREVLLLVTDSGIVVATFRSRAMADLYIEQIRLTWMFAHQVGRSGI